MGRQILTTCGNSGKSAIGLYRQTRPFKKKKNWEKKCRNAVNNETKQAKEQYYKNVLQDNERDPCKTWQIINELTTRKTHSSSVKEIKLDNNSIRDPFELSSVFNNYFSSIGLTLINDIHYPTNGPSHFHYIVETEHIDLI